jgi:hypothetical protein
MVLKKKKRSAKKGSSAKRTPKQRIPEDLPKLTETEQDLLWHMEHGYRLETDSLGGDPVLRSSKGDEVLRPASANRNTVKALEERGLITQGKSRDPLKIAWQGRKLGPEK